MISLKPWTSLGTEEEGAALRVIRSGLLSGHLGGLLEGGPEVQSLEREWSAINGGHSVAVNSATSGILIALKAVGVGAGTKVIVSPYSMSAGVACVRWLGAIPVFADIDDSYCLDPDAVEDLDDDAVAVLTTNLFGGVATPPETFVPIIEDNAQAPFTHDSYAEVTIDSFNVHKPMQAGEGGICTTADHHIARQLKLLRNHGELAAGPPGLNLRMTEISAAIAREQLLKGPAILEYRRKLAKQFIQGLSDIRDIAVRPYDHGNAYYVFPVRVDISIRDRMVKELQEKGVPVRAGYGGPLYRLPAFRPYARECPNCELIDRELIILEFYVYELNEYLIDRMIEAYHKVFHAVVRT